MQQFIIDLVKTESLCYACWTSIICFLVDVIATDTENIIEFDWHDDTLALPLRVPLQYTMISNLHPSMAKTQQNGKPFSVQKAIAMVHGL